MAEDSFWWTSNDTGDGAASGYTQAELSLAAKALAACSGFEGVAPGLLNELAPTANGANTVAVNTGGGVVDGKPYHNSASVDVNIPSAAGGGNTRIDRIVLRAGWAAQTVRITRVAGTDAGSPTAPDMTQTSGTTYDISLCTVLVDTDGVVTVTDARTFAKGGANSLSSAAVTTVKLLGGAVTSAKIATGAVATVKLAASAVTSAKLATDAVATIKLAASAVTSAKIAAGAIAPTKLAASAVTSAKIATGAVATVKLADSAVTSAKIAAGAVVLSKMAADSVTGTAAGNRIIQIHRREGGGATAWTTAGTNDYTPTTVRMQVGAGMGGSPITFPVAFSKAPIVLMQGAGATAAHLTVSAISASGFSIEGIAEVKTFYWLAIGPE